MSADQNVTPKIVNLSGALLVDKAQALKDEFAAAFSGSSQVLASLSSVEELKADKPEEYERLVASGELQERLSDPLPDVLVRAFRAFGWTALLIGTGLVIWIICAMILAYK